MDHSADSVLRRCFVGCLKRLPDASSARRSCAVRSVDAERCFQKDQRKSFGAESFHSPVFVSLFSHCSAETEADVLGVSLKPKHAEPSAA